MVSSNRSTLSIVPALLALVVLILVGFLLFSDLKISRTEQTLNPPIEIIDPQLPLTVIELEEETPSSEQVIEKEATIFIDALATDQEKSITINENQDQFVRHDSIIILPKLEKRITTIKELLADPNISADTALFRHDPAAVCGPRWQLIYMADLAAQFVHRGWVQFRRVRLQ